MKSNFPDNIHIGSPNHDRMVCEITPELLSRKLPYVKDFLNPKTWELKWNNISDVSKNLWDYLKNRQPIPGISPESNIKILKEYDTFISTKLNPNSLKFSYEVPVINQGNGNYKTIVGYWDVIVHFNHSKMESSFFKKEWKLEYPPISSFYIEVKPEIESLGAILRQINLYKQFSTGKIYIYTSDKRFNEQLISQDIGIIES